MNLAEAAAEADALAQAGDERTLASLRSEWDDELEAAARDADYRTRAQAYRAIAQFRFRQKLELLRRGLEDESPRARWAPAARRARGGAPGPPPPPRPRAVRRSSRSRGSPGTTPETSTRSDRFCTRSSRATRTSPFAGSPSSV